MGLLHLSGLILGYECSETCLEWRKKPAGLNEPSEKMPLWSLITQFLLKHLLYINKIRSAFLGFEYSIPEGKKLPTGE